MFTEAGITEIYCIADDFCKKFASLQAEFMFEDKKTKRRNKPNRMNDTGTMVILILSHSGGFRCFKHYCIGYVCKRLRSLFPYAVSYNRFVELEKETPLPLAVFIKKVLSGTCTGISFMDSTPLRVCRNQRKLCADKGYIGQALFENLFPDGIQPVTKVKNSMRNSLMSIADKILLRKQALIETVNDGLKNIAQTEHSRHRSFNNLIANVLSAIAACCFFEKKPAIDLCFVKDSQLACF